ncbi:LysE family translocator [Pseudalkalibacillus sp. NRS-1564]|uniref:LysE family translocator n=1 Tax=Pseudalkalibacillus sp. NRS-1564 TaxID=3233900 RepID=UPI003D29335D
MSIVAFLSYVIITSITPGPSNLLMMNEARRFGFVGAWQFNSGIMAGFAALGMISGVFTTGLYKWIPIVEPFLKIAGAAYLLYLAWKISFPENSKKETGVMQSSFISGFIFQVINVKSILFFLTVMSAFILPFHKSIPSIAFYLAMAILLGWLALLLWSAFGSLLKNFLSKHDRPFRIIMGGLLIYSGVTIFLN